MARPPDADAKQTRQRILNAASLRFAEQGMGNVSMRTLAQEAGVTQATVHHYFGSKAELYEAAIDAMYGELSGLRSELAAVILAESSPAGIVAAAVKATFRFAMAHQGAMRMVMRQIIDQGGLPVRRHRELLMPFLDEFSMMLAAYTGQAPQGFRLPLQSLIFLVVRYSLMSASEMVAVSTGKRSRRRSYDPQVLTMVEQHLMGLAIEQLGLTVSGSGEQNHSRMES